MAYRSLRWSLLSIVVAAACGASKPDDGASTSGSASSSTTETAATSSGTADSGGSSSTGDQIPPLVQCGAQECDSGEVCAVAMSSCCGYSSCVDVTSCVASNRPIAECACEIDDAAGYDPATGIATCEILSCDTTACSNLGDSSGGVC